jgi:hypothetical protein
MREADGSMFVLLAGTMIVELVAKRTKFVHFKPFLVAGQMLPPCTDIRQTVVHETAPIALARRRVRVP